MGGPYTEEWRDHRFLVWLKVGKCTKRSEVDFLRNATAFDDLPACDLVESAHLLRILAKDCDDAARARGATIPAAKPSTEAIEFWLETRLRDAIDNPEAIQESLAMLKVSRDHGDNPAEMMRKILADFVLRTVRNPDPAGSAAQTITSEQLKAACQPGDKPVIGESGRHA